MKYNILTLFLDSICSKLYYYLKHIYLYGDWFPYLLILLMLTIAISSADSSEGASNLDGFDTGVVLIDCFCLSVACFSLLLLCDFYTQKYDFIIERTNKLLHL